MQKLQDIVFRRLANAMKKYGGWNRFVLHNINKSSRSYRFYLSNGYKPGLVLDIYEENKTMDAKFFTYDLIDDEEERTEHLLQVNMHDPKSINKLKKFAEIAKREHSQILEDDYPYNYKTTTKVYSLKVK